MFHDHRASEPKKFNFRALYKCVQGNEPMSRNFWQASREVGRYGIYKPVES